MSHTADELVTVGRPLPSLAAIAPCQGFEVLITWSSGRQETVDLTPHLARYGVFAPLDTDRGLFETVRLADEGHTVVFGNDPEDDTLAIPATTIAWLAETQSALDDQPVRRLFDERVRNSRLRIAR